MIIINRNTSIWIRWLIAFVTRDDMWGMPHHYCSRCLRMCSLWPWIWTESHQRLHPEQLALVFDKIMNIPPTLFCIFVIILFIFKYFLINLHQLTSLVAHRYSMIVDNNFTMIIISMSIISRAACNVSWVRLRRRQPASVADRRQPHTHRTRGSPHREDPASRSLDIYCFMCTYAKLLPVIISRC